MVRANGSGVLVQLREIPARQSFPKQVGWSFKREFLGRRDPAAGREIPRVVHLIFHGQKARRGFHQHQPQAQPQPDCRHPETHSAPHRRGHGPHHRRADRRQREPHRQPELRVIVAAQHRIPLGRRQQPGHRGADPQHHARDDQAARHTARGGAFTPGVHRLLWPRQLHFVSNQKSRFSSRG